MRLLLTNVVIMLTLVSGLKAQDSIALRQANASAYRVYLTDPDSSIAIATAVQIFAKKAGMKYALGESYYVLSKASWAKGNFRLSLDYGYKSLQVFQNTTWTYYWGQTNLSLARTFLDLGELAKAKVLIDQTRRIAARTADKNMEADAWREYSFLLSQKQLYDSAIIISDKAIALYNPETDLRDIGILYSRKARVYSLQKNYSKSAPLIQKSIAIDIKTGNRRGLCVLYFHNGENFYHQGKFDSALFYVKKADALAVRLGNLSLRIRCHEMIAAIQEKRNGPVVALGEYKMVLKLKDSLQRQEINRQVEEANALNELENKERAMVILSEENASGKQSVRNQQWISGGLLIGILLLACIIILLFRLRRSQSWANRILSDKNTAIELQRQEIQSQAENLRNLNQLKSKLFSVISHDLRGPINNLQVLLDLLTQKAMTPEEFLALSGKLKMDVSINQRTLENLLAWSLSQMDGIKTEPKFVRVNDVFSEVAQMMHEMAERKGISLQMSANENLTVFTDYNQVLLILRNLVHNAIKFSMNNEIIVLEARSEDHFCRIKIRDNGVGMDQREVEILSDTQEFYTRTGTQQEKGTGLGWLLCKEFIKRNGGSFKITSAPKNGTEVSFTLPVVK